MPQPKQQPPDFEAIMYAAGLELGLAFAAATTAPHDFEAAIHYLGAARVEIDKAEALLRAAIVPRGDNVIPFERRS